MNEGNKTYIGKGGLYYMGKCIVRLPEGATSSANISSSFWPMVVKTSICGDRLYAAVSNDGQHIVFRRSKSVMENLITKDWEYYKEKEEKNSRKRKTKRIGTKKGRKANDKHR